MRHGRRILMLAVLAALGGGCQAGNAPICDGEALSRALGEAEAGDTVRVGACRIAGAFTVPDGVTLSGAGAGESVLESSGEDPVLRLEARLGGATRVADLALDSSGVAGLVALGEGGEVEVDGVTITASRGVGAGFEGLAALHVHDTLVEGTVTATNADRIIGDAGDEHPAFGLIISLVEEAELTEVAVEGFVAYGALLVESETTWRGGDASGNLLVGLRADGGSVTLEDVTLSETLMGLNAYAYGGLFNQTTVSTVGVDASGNASFGLIHVASTVDHVDLVARDNGHTALWSQQCPSFSLAGAATVLRGNAFAGVVSIGNAELELRDARIEATALASRLLGESGQVTMGDGVQIVGVGTRATLRDLTLDTNARAGVVIDLDGEDTSGLTIEGVTVSGEGAAFGVVAQHGDLAEGWDDGVLREGAIETNDAGFSTPLEVVEARGLSIDERPDSIIGDAGLVASIIGDAG